MNRLYKKLIEQWILLNKNAYKMVKDKCFFNIMHMYRVYLYMCVYVQMCVCVCACVREPPGPFQFSLSHQNK